MRLAREQRRDVGVADHVATPPAAGDRAARAQHVDAGEHPLRHRALGRPRRARVEDARRPGRSRRRRWRPSGAAPDRRAAAWWRRRRRARVRGQQRRQVEIGHHLGVHHQHRPARRTAAALWRCRRPSRAARSRPSRRSRWPRSVPADHAFTQDRLDQVAAVEHVDHRAPGAGARGGVQPEADGRVAANRDQRLRQRPVPARRGASNGPPRASMTFTPANIAVVLCQTP